MESLQMRLGNPFTLPTGPTTASFIRRTTPKLIKFWVGISYRGLGMIKHGIKCFLWSQNYVNFSGKTFRLRTHAKWNLFVLKMFQIKLDISSKKPLRFILIVIWCSRGDMAYFHPDFESGILGQFEANGLLIEGKQVVIEKVIFDHEFLVPTVKLSAVSGDSLKADVSTRTRLSKNPTLRDPFEARTTEVRKSSVDGAGDGVFVLRDTPNATVVGYFNGIRLHADDVFGWNPFAKKSVYLVEAGDENDNEYVLDIPPQFTNWSKYNVTCGHKVSLHVPFVTARSEHHFRLTLTSLVFSLFPPKRSITIIMRILVTPIVGIPCTGTSFACEPTRYRFLRHWTFDITRFVCSKPVTFCKLNLPILLSRF